MDLGLDVAPARLLVVDDEPAMHDSYRRSFPAMPADGRAAADAAALGAMAVELFGASTAPVAADTGDFTVTHHHQGLDAVAAVERALAAGEPYHVAFIDVRMPPGIDGRETARRIRALDPAIAIVIVTGYSDFSPLEIARTAGPVDKIFYLAKPFEVAEIVQTARALSARWHLDRDLAHARDLLARQVTQLEEQKLELAANESRAVHIALHDSLTDAPNRLAFQRALAERARRPGAFATAMIDLDRFKLVNDTLGHHAGDRLIQEICAILSDAAPPGALVARLGGDEFGILFDTTGEAAAQAACERIIAACSVTVRVFGHSVRGGASAGLIVTAGGTGPDSGATHGPDPGDVLRRADLALNDAKRHGRGIVRLFDESMDESIRFRRRIETDLAGAIARGELALEYQPIVSGDRIEVVGFEALLRWHSEDYGPMSPETFVPIAEESNLIHDLGDWVLDHAMAESLRWPGQYVSINVSPRQFRRHDFVGHIAACAARAGVSPDRVQIEITETAIFDDADRAALTLDRLRAMGFRIALDDFGTGYSSLYNIRTFGLDCLKIDKSFIDGMGRERESAAIVRAIIHLGRALGLGVVAEGVETEAQAQALRLAGASHLQGHYLAHPVPPREARELAAERFIGGGARALALADGALTVVGGTGMGGTGLQP